MILAGSLVLRGETPGVYGLDWTVARQSISDAIVSLLNAGWGWHPWLAPAGELPNRAKLALTILLLGGGAAGMVWLARRRGVARGRDAPSSLRLGLILVGFSLAHAGVVAASFVLVEFPRPALNDRVLLPSQLTFILGLVFLGWYALSHPRNSWLASIFALVLIGPILNSSLRPTYGLLTRLHAEGWGYTGQEWEGLPILTILRQIQPQAPIISNDNDAVTFFARRPAFRLPDLDERIAETEWRPFGETRRLLAEREFADRAGYLVLFPSALGQLMDVYGGEAEARLDSLVDGLKIVYEGSDGTIYTR
jgi:hypothetical protein